MMQQMRRRMQHGWPACAAVLCLAAALGAQTPAGQTLDWQTYSYPPDGFSASFPAAPQLSKQNIPTSAGTFELRGYLVDLGTVAFYVGVNDYGTAVSGRDPQTVLAGAMNGAVSNVKAHVLSTQKVTLGVYPGVTFEAENDSLHFSGRIYLVGSTLYQTFAANPLGPVNPDAARFLDSFQLIPRTAQ